MPRVKAVNPCRAKRRQAQNSTKGSYVSHKRDVGREQPQLVTFGSCCQPDFRKTTAFAVVFKLSIQLLSCPSYSGEVRSGKCRFPERSRSWRNSGPGGATALKKFRYRKSRCVVCCRD